MSSKRELLDDQLVQASLQYRNRFKVIKQIIPQSQVYLCRDLNKGQQEVVLKLEPIRRKNSRLQKEISFYEKLKESEYFPIFKYWFFGLFHRILVLAKKGINLRIHWKNVVNAGQWDETLFNIYAKQMIKSLEKLHSFGIIHLDPKPNNFVLDSNDSNKIFLIDFDLAKEYKTEDSKHIPRRTDLKPFEINGNRQFLSIYGHQGYQQSRRDDLIFLGYSLIWMSRGGNLPWSLIKPEQFASNTEYHKQLKAEKCKLFKEMEEMSTKEGRVYQSLVEYMVECYRLGFDEDPDYKYLISLFEN